MLSSCQGNSATCGFVTNPKKSTLSSEKPQTDKGYFLLSLRQVSDFVGSHHSWEGE